MDRPSPAPTAPIEAEHDSPSWDSGGSQKATHSYLRVALVARGALTPPRCGETCYLRAGGAGATRPQGR
eukprot:6559994-Alexandrium_andersonii.AAC.1